MQHSPRLFKGDGSFLAAEIRLGADDVYEQRGLFIFIAMRCARSLVLF
jgi:hypothetical protein